MTDLMSAAQRATYRLDDGTAIRTAWASVQGAIVARGEVGLLAAVRAGYSRDLDRAGVHTVTVVDEHGAPRTLDRARIDGVDVEVSARRRPDLQRIMVRVEPAGGTDG